MQRKNSIIIIALLAVAAIAGFLQYQKNDRHLISEVAAATSYITEKMESCDADNNNCYKTVAEEITNNINSETIFKVFENEEKQKAFFGSCHTTLHFIGQIYYQKTHNISKLLGSGTPVCFAGYYHGALEGYLSESNYSDVELRKSIQKLCDQSQFDLPKNYQECLHGLGHALMYVSDGELPQALELCNELEPESDKNWCYSGAFMENSTSSTNHDHPSKYLRKDDLNYPCTILAEKYLNMCYTLQSFYFAEISEYDWHKTIALCKQVPESYQVSCFNAYGQEQVGFTADLNKIKINCDLVDPGAFRNACINGVVGTLGQRFINGFDSALEFCTNYLDSKNESTLQNVCFERLVNQTYYWFETTEKRTAYCRRISIDKYKNNCLAKYEI